MEFSGMYRNHFSSKMHYNYFTGNGFNLGQSFLAKSPAQSAAVVGSKIPPTLPDLNFEDGTRKRTSSCPLPTPKYRFEHYQPLTPVVDEFPDDKLNADSPEVISHVLVTGPPYCGKHRLVEVLAKRNLQVHEGVGPYLAFNKCFSISGVKVNTHIWYLKNPKACCKVLKDAFSGKNFAIILVYDVTVPNTIHDARLHIEGFKRDFGSDVPIILIGNKTVMRTLIHNELSMLDWGLLGYSDGQKIRDEYKLADFLECTGETSHGIYHLLFKASTLALRDKFKF